MNWFLLAVTLAVTAYTYWKMNNLPGPTAQKWQRPTAEEGGPIPVLFGTAVISAPNITWFADVSSRPSDPPFEPQTIRYEAGVEFGLCHGCIDKLVGVTVGGKEAFRGPHDDGTDTFDADAEIWCNVYDGPDANGDGVALDTQLNRGVVATSTSDGTATSQADLYISDFHQMPSGKVWKNNGVATLRPTRRGWMGNGAYLKPWAFRAQRIWRTNGGNSAQWYPEKAAIVIGRNLEDVWKYHLQQAADSTDCSAISFDDSGWEEGPGGFGNAETGYYGQGNDVKEWTSRVPKVGTCVANEDETYPDAWRWPPNVVNGTKLWVRGDLGPLPAADLGVRLWHDDSRALWFNGTAITPTEIPDQNDPESHHYNSYAKIPASLIDTDGPNVIAYKVTETGSGAAKYIYAGIQVGVDVQQPAASWDMNPAHIIHEVLTDTVWGLGYTTSDIDDTSFRAAADTLYDERLGMSLLWSEQGKVEDFLAEIVRHIDGVLYIDRTTGKFVLNLLRDDYTVGALLTLDESNVVSIQNANRRGTGELTNSVTVTFRRAPLGDKGSVTAHDSGLQTLQGGVVGANIDYPGFTNAHAANMAAQRNLRALSTPVLSCDLECNREAAVLNVGVAFVLDWTDLDIYEVMRVKSIEYGDGSHNTVKISAVEDVFFTPTMPIVTAAPIGWPPQVLGPLPGSTEATQFVTCQKYDPLDCGDVKCVFLGAHTQGGNDPMFYGAFTETSPGVMTCNTLGSISAWFDGVVPDVGDTVIAWYQGDFTNNASTIYELAHQGPYVVTHLGDGSNYAVLTKLSTFEFIKGSTFHIEAAPEESGSLYGDKYLTLAHVPLSLTFPTLWTIADTFTPDEGRALLTPEELADSHVRGDTLTATVTMANGSADFDGFATEVLGESLIDGGPWIFQAEAVWLTADDPAATITLGWKVYLFDGSTSVLLFEAVSEAIHNTTAKPLITRYTGPTIDCYETDRFLVIPCLHTTSVGPVTMHLTYNSPAHRTGVTSPYYKTKKTIDPHIYGGGKGLKPGFDGSIITISSSAGPVTITLPSGAEVKGISSPSPSDGDLLILTIYGATNVDPIIFKHDADVPESAKSIFLSSEAGDGLTYEDLSLRATRARLMLNYNATEGSWQLLPGGSIA